MQNLDQDALQKYHSLNAIPKHVPTQCDSSIFGVFSVLQPWLTSATRLQLWMVRWRNHGQLCTLHCHYGIDSRKLHTMFQAHNLNFLLFVLLLWVFFKEYKSAYCLIVIPLIKNFKKWSQHGLIAPIPISLIHHSLLHYFTVHCFYPSSTHDGFPKSSRDFAWAKQTVFDPRHQIKLAVYTDGSQMSHFLLPVRLCIQTLNV